MSPQNRAATPTYVTPPGIVHGVGVPFSGFGFGVPPARSPMPPNGMMRSFGAQEQRHGPGEGYAAGGNFFAGEGHTDMSFWAAARLLDLKSSLVTLGRRVI